MDLQTVLNAMTHAGNKIFELFSFKILMAAVFNIVFCTNILFCLWDLFFWFLLIV